MLNNLLNILSAKNNSKPPAKKPTSIVNHGFKFNEIALSIAGDSNEKYEAAIMTPAANPNIASIIFLLIFLKKKTILAPKAVIPYVNNVANNA